MAKIHEEVILVRLSKLINEKKDKNVTIVNDEIKDALEQVAQELVGENIVVEIELNKKG